METVLRESPWLDAGTPDIPASLDEAAGKYLPYMNLILSVATKLTGNLVEARRVSEEAFRSAILAEWGGERSARPKMRLLTTLRQVFLRQQRASILKK